MISLVAALLLAAAVDPTPATAGPAGEPAAAAAVAAVEKKGHDPNERVCWTEKPTGSHVPQEICTTRAQHELMERDARDSLQRNSRGGPGKFGPQ